MTPFVDPRHRVARQLGLVGGGLGVLAGIVQATVGTSIPEWTGAKAAPGALGMLTIVLSAVAGYAAWRQSRPGLTTASRAATALGLLGPALLCFTTVGRLWYLPGLLLLAAGILTVDRWQDTASMIAKNWMRCLLSLVGASELIMAAGAPPLLMAVGAVGGIALIAASWLRHAHRRTLLGLLVIGTVPFAVLAWTAVVPVLLLLVAAGVAVPVLRGAPARVPSHTDADLKVGTPSPTS